MRYSRPAGWLVVVAVVAAAGVQAMPFGAAPSARTEASAWSGGDARNYDGEIRAPGDLIAQEPLDPLLSVRGAARAERILYSTLNQHGAPAVSTAAVFVPKGSPPQGGWPTIAWAHGTVGLADDCAPSASPRSEFDDGYLSHWLDEGYVIVGTDYVGLGTPGLMSYLNGVASARAVIDSVVALHQTDLPLSRQWAIVGHSQGGAAAMNSARLATEFTRGTGLDYRGVVATGTPANVQEIIERAGPDMTLPQGLGSAATGYVASILAGFREARPDLDVDRVLTPAGLFAVHLAETLCKPQLDEALATTAPAQFFAAPLAALPGVSKALDEYMGTPVSGYDRPIFLAVGLLDGDVPPSSTLTFYDALVANGQPVEMHVYPDQDHGGTVYAALADSTPFLHRVFGPH